MSGNGRERGGEGVSLEFLAGLAGGQARDGEGLRVSGLRPFDEAGPFEITAAVNASYLSRLDETRAGALIVPVGADTRGRPALVSPNPYLAFAKITAHFHPPPRPYSGISHAAVIGKEFACGADPGIAPAVVIGNKVTVGDRCLLYPGVVVGDGVVLGDDVRIYPNVSVLERSKIGNRVIIHAGAVIGSDGFGQAPDGTGYFKIPHTGTVQIDDDVEIGANNTIDRGTFGRTWIQRGVKTDNLVHVAHNVTVGEDTLLVAQTGISGSATIGRHAVMAGQSGCVGHITIGDNAVVIAQAGVGQSVPPGEVVSGTPAMPHRQWLKVQSIVARLPELRKKLLDLERRLKRLEGKGDGHGS